MYAIRAKHARIATALSLPLLGAIILLSGSTDVPARFSIGASTALAGLTALYAVSLLMAWMMNPVIPRRTAATLLFGGCFLVWGLLSGTTNDVTLRGVQNLLVVSVFLGAIVVGARLAVHSRDSQLILTKTLKVVSLGAALVYLVSSLFFGLGTDVVFGPRPFALFLLLGLSVCLTDWRMGSRIALFHGLIIAVAIAASLSRIALAAAIMMFVISRFRVSRVRSWIESMILTGILVAAVVLAIGSIPGVRERFTDTRTPIEVAGLRIGSSGRANMWPVTFGSFFRSPLIGNGPGAAADLMESRFGLAHPHNDYLRILHDFGAIGFVFWILMWLTLIRSQWKTGTAHDSRGRYSSNYSPGFLGTLGLAVAMLTDNVIAYVFVLGPLGVLIGLSLGAMILSNVQQTKALGSFAPD